MIEGTMLKTIGELGLPVGLVCYFLIRDYYRERASAKREDAMVARIQSLEEEYRKELTVLVVSCNSAASAHTSTLKALTRTVQALVNILSRRPCVSPDAEFVPAPHKEHETDTLMRKQ